MIFMSHHRCIRIAASLLGSTMLATGLAGQASAQDAAATVAPQEGAVGASNDEIIVTARRREENIQSVPASVTALGQETLEKFRVEDLRNVAAFEPSFSVSASSGRPNSPVYSLRGIRPTESVYGQDPTVAVYLAEVVQSPAQGSNLGFYDLQNVQVLKGPQGTLFGRNTIGGALLLTPRKPGDSFAVDAMAGVGSFGLFETQLGVDIPLADTFRVRVAGRTIDGGDYQTNVAPGPLFGTKLGGQKTRSVRVTMLGELSPDVTNTVMATYDEKNTNSRGGTLQAVNPLHPRAGALPAFAAALTRAQNRPITDVESDLNQFDNVAAWSVSDTFQANLSDDLTFKFIGAYREVDTNTLYDLDATSLVGILTTEQQASLDHASLEAQLQGQSFDGALDWVVGGYWYHESGIERSPGAFFGTYIVQSGTVDNTSYSAFAQGSWHITPELTFTAGARMNWDEKAMQIVQTVNGTICTLTVDNGLGNGGTVRLPISNCQIDLKDKFSQPTGTVSLDYKVTPDVLVYVTSRLGYRSGGFNIRGTQPIQYLPFGEETVTDFEGGIKADWTLGGISMRTNLAAFYQKYSDIQRTVAVATALGSPASVVTNAASAHVYGLEVQQTIRPADWLTFKLNYAYNRPAYDEWIDPATNTDLKRTPFFFTPRHSGSGMVTIDKELPGNAGSLQFSANAAYTGGTWINALHTIAMIEAHPASVMPLLRQEAYWLVDLSAGWRDIGGSNVDVSLYVKNLTQTQYKVGGIQLYTGASGFISAAYGEPRTYGAQLRFRF